MARSDAEILGRDDVNDLDAILAMTNQEVDEAVHVVNDNADAIFTWDYERSPPPLVKLYEKAKTSQWNGETDLPWDTEVDPARDVAASPMTPMVRATSTKSSTAGTLPRRRVLVARCYLDANRGDPRRPAQAAPE